MVNIYDAYGEDGDFIWINSGTGGGTGINFLTADYYYRSTINSGYPYSRCGLGFSNDGNGGLGRRIWPTPLTTGWFGARMAFTGDGFTSVKNWLALIDSSQIPRILFQMITDGSGHGSVGNFNVFKVNAAGTITQLGSASTNGFSYNARVPDKISVNFDYSVSGFITVYLNSGQVFTYSGDITTDGITEIAGTQHANHGAGNSSDQIMILSECVVADSDVRDLSVITNVANGAGSVDQWSGTYTDVTGYIAHDVTFNTANASGETQLYTMTPLQSGNFNVLAKVTALRASQGSGGLGNIALTEVVNSGTYSTSTVSIPSAFGQVQFIQQINPATGVAWTLSDLNTSRQSGFTATT